MRVKTLTTPQTHDNFSYDAIGNLLEKTTPSETLTYTYDALYQLTSEPGHTYKYDSHYNRIDKDGQRYTLNSLNQILKHDNAQYTYSANGALIKKVQNDEVTTYSYDGLDRLVKVVQEDDVTTYRYDAFNRRVSKTQDNKTIKYLYQDQNEIGSYAGNTPQELRVLGLGQGAEIGATVFLELFAQTYVPMHDQNGNVSALFSLSGTCLETYRYTAFGEEQFSNRIANPWRFSSKRYDPETGFLYFGQRYYAADLGHWITPDPLEFEDGPNLYAYVHNNPLISIDLYGLFDNLEDYDFSYRSSYSDFHSFGQGVGNSIHKYCFGNIDAPAQNNMVSIDEEKGDYHKNWLIGSAIGALATASAPFVASGMAAYGAYKYGSKFVNYVTSGVCKFVTSRKSARLVLKEKDVLINLSECKVSKAEKLVNSYLGEGTRLISNKAKDPVFLSRDGLRKVRFDFNTPKPHENPHMHVELLINGERVSYPFNQIYPIDVLHL